MRATTTLLENNKVMLTVEIDDAEMDEAIDAAAKTLAKQVTVKGFRKGKVPKNVLIANIGGPSVLRSEAIRESLPDFYARAVADSLIDPIGQPDINITAGEDEGHEGDPAVQGPPVLTQALDDLEHEVERVLPHPGPLGHVRAQADSREDRPRSGCSCAGGASARPGSRRTW